MRTRHAYQYICIMYTVRTTFHAIRQLSYDCSKLLMNRTCLELIMSYDPVKTDPESARLIDTLFLGDRFSKATLKLIIENGYPIILQSLLNASLFSNDAFFYILFTVLRQKSSWDVFFKNLAFRLTGYPTRPSVYQVLLSLISTQPPRYEYYWRTTQYFFCFKRKTRYPTINKFTFDAHL